MKYVFICFLLIHSLALGSDTKEESRGGIITGVIIDDETKEPVIGATILLRGTNYGAVTDMDGRYVLRGIPAGEYEIVFSYIGYNKITLSEVQVRTGERLVLDVIMEQGTLSMSAVTVSAYRQYNTTEAVLTDIRLSPQVVSGVSSQVIIKSQDSNAAQVLQRIPGITIADNRFVIIRGLSERYNNVMINNVVAPSTEVDKRTFSFDLISSSALDRMMIYKSGSADLPGDFAGGVIKVFTVDQVGEDFTNLSYGIGFRNGSTGQRFLQSGGSPTDLLGFDNGYRSLPSNFPDTRSLQESPRNAELRANAAHSLNNNFLPTESTAFMDQSIGFGMGRTFRINNTQISNITTVNYSTGNQYYQRDFYRYFEWEDRSQPILQRFAFVDDNYTEEAKISLMTNWIFRPNRDNTFRFKNLFNQIGEHETIIRNGKDFIQRPDDELRNYLLGYRSRSIYTGQIEGTHRLSDYQNANWTLGGSFLNESEPDLRRFRTFRDESDPDDSFSMQMPPSSNLFDTGRYYGNLSEYSLNHGFDYEHGLSGFLSNVKTGYLIDYRNRDFNSRYISYLYPGFFDPNKREELIRLPLDQIFSEKNIGTRDTFVIEEGTRPIDSYSASSLTSAAFVTGDISLESTNLSLGLRAEYNVQKMNSQDDFSAITVENPVLSILPFVNISQVLSDKLQLRLGYSRTINRPEFREMAPFVFYDYKLDAGRSGNPGLKTATIDNADIRFEIYPRLGEMISIGVFYKYFDSPIENKTTVTTESPQFGYINAVDAYNFGVEAEVKKSLLGVTSVAFIDKLSLNANASWIYSKVDLGEQAVAQNQERPLQGQSPYIVNTAVYYDDTATGFSASMIYNIIGPRIFSVGDVLFPTIYEMPRHSLDLTVSKAITPKAKVKLGVQDVLNSQYRFVQDSNRNDRPDSQDDIIFSYTRGQMVNMTFSYSF